ncbi:hypothetical protein C8T65DRAFT_750215 [Cerioporus squamosus]|nr:hypothetical protein C8T65DRAFT_750215 [Cerioporus squamosus]
MGVIVDVEEAALADLVKREAAEESPRSPGSHFLSQESSDSTSLHVVALPNSPQEKSVEPVGSDFLILEAEDADISAAVKGKRLAADDPNDTENQGSQSESDMEVDEYADGEASQLVPPAGSGDDRERASSGASTLSDISDDVQTVTLRGWFDR